MDMENVLSRIVKEIRESSDAKAAWARNFINAGNHARGQMLLIEVAQMRNWSDLLEDYENLINKELSHVR